MSSEVRSLKQHVRVLDAAYQEERHQRDVLEKKYARLKRRYIRLERAHAKIVLETHEMFRGGGDRPSLPSPRDANNECQSPRAERDARPSLQPLRDAYRSSAYATEHERPLQRQQQRDRSPPDTNNVIDLTSPTSRSHAAAARTWTADAPSPVMYMGSHSVARALSDDDYCAESPGSTPGDSNDNESSAERMRRNAPTSASNRAAWLRHPVRSALDYQQPVISTTHTHSSAERLLDDSERIIQTASVRGSSSSASARPRPRPGVVDSPDRRLRRALEQDRDYDVAHRRRRLDASTAATATVRLAVAATAAAARPSLPSSSSPRSSVASSPTTINSSPQSSPHALDDLDDDNDHDAASLALAQYLQHQENVAAFQEYQARTAERERLATVDATTTTMPSHMLGDDSDHARAIDPDTMTYDELLALGEQNGDVKKERWRQMAVQVLSCLPTHRWTGGSDSDVSCIICQYGFQVDDRALTLPCAHVFHEECVGGWIRENNSCPLCKLEIVPM